MQFDHIQNGTDGLEARMTQKELKKKILKDYLEINMRIWNNIKMDIKGYSFVFKLNSSLQHGAEREFCLHTKTNIFKNFAI
jgi:hypothetical protein